LTWKTTDQTIANSEQGIGFVCDGKHILKHWALAQKAFTHSKFQDATAITVTFNLKTGAGSVQTLIRIASESCTD
jgi:hypothetical protein